MLNQRDMIQKQENQFLMKKNSTNYSTIFSFIILNYMIYLNQEKRCVYEFKKGF